MTQLLESNFDDILKRFSDEVAQHKEGLSFSIIGSALMQSDVLILGNNWGGDEDVASQVDMPLVNDILVNQSNPTYRGYLNFFQRLFVCNKLEAIIFLNRVIYTNGNFIRTPNETQRYSESLELGYNLTNKYLTEIIKVTRSRVIICFGNSTRSATSAAFRALGISGDFWKIKNINIQQTYNKWSTYHLSVLHEGRTYELYSFPHASKLNIWGTDIESNPIFFKLKRQLADIH